MRVMLIAAAAAIAAGCAADGGAGVSADNDGLPLRAFFRCDSGGAMTAQFFGGDRVVVTTSAGASYDLERTTGASGYQYGDGTVSFTTDLTTATLAGAPYAFGDCAKQS